jgi:hypothetical protein
MIAISFMPRIDEHADDAGDALGMRWRRAGRSELV